MQPKQDFGRKELGVASFWASMGLQSLLKEYLKTHKQVELAEAADVSDGAVSKWRSGKQLPDFESCLRIARVLNCDPMEIFERQEDIDLYRSFFPEFQPKPAPVVGCDDPAHLEFVASVHRAIDEGVPLEAMRKGIEALLLMRGLLPTMAGGEGDQSSTLPIRKRAGRVPR